MKKWLLKYTSICTIIALLAGGIGVTDAFFVVSAEEIAADFEIDPELLDVLINNNTFKLDMNNDGILSVEEMADCYGIQIDCEGYDIKDWSALEYGTNWKYVAIDNIAEADLSSLGNLEELNTLKISCKDFNKITGVEKIESLKDITIESETDVDLSVFTAYQAAVDKRMNSLSITAPKFINYESLKDVQLFGLSLSGASKDGLENLPMISYLDTLKLGFNDITDTDMKKIVSVNTGLRNVSVTNAQLSGLSWIHDLKYLYTLDVRNNMVRDIRTILEHKNIKNMDLSISGNPYMPDAENMLVEKLLEFEDGISGTVGEKEYVESINHTEWECDIVGDLMFYCADAGIADVDGYYIRFYSSGETTLYVTDGKNVNLSYPISVVGNNNVTPKPTSAPDEVLSGDADIDGKVNARDALLALKHAAKMIILSDQAYTAADVNVDYKVTAIDARHILEYVAGLIYSFDSVVSDITPVPTASVPTDTPKPTPKPTTGYEKFDSVNVDLDYTNSFIVELISAENKNFSAADFSEVELADVWTRGKVKTEDGYLYQLVMVLNKENCTKEALKEAMEYFETLDMVNLVDYNEYYEHETVLDLNYQEYEIEVGESISLYIKDYRPYNESVNNVGLWVRFNSAISIDELRKYGVTDMSSDTSVYPDDSWYSPETADYLLSVYGGYSNEINCLTVAHLLSQLPEVDMVQISRMAYPTGNRYRELWNISDESVASMELVGGVDDPLQTSAVTKLDQSATITGISPGEVVVSVTRDGWGNSEGTGTCVIKIVEP